MIVARMFETADINGSELSEAHTLGQRERFKKLGRPKL